MNNNYLGTFLTLTVAEESRHERARAHERRRQIQEARAARRAQRHLRVTALAARVRQALQRDPCPQLT